MLSNSVKLRIFTTLYVCLSHALASGVHGLSVKSTAKNINEIYLQNLLRNLNTSADPCMDFYQYACGNWAQNYASTEYVDMPGYMDYKVNKQLLEIITAQSSAAQGASIYAKVWQHYQSCTRLSKPALNSYLQLVEPELKLQWPIFRADWNKPWENETAFDWLSTVALLRSYGLNGVFITQNINVRLSNGSHHLLEVHQHQSHKELQAPAVAEIFTNFGMSAEQCKSVTSNVMLLEEKMKNLTLSEFKIEIEDDQSYQNNFKELTVHDLIVKVPALDWHRYFEIALGRSVHIEEELVQTFALNLNYFSDLIKVLNSTSNETICYYIMLKFMYQLNEDLPQVKDLSTQCIKHLRGYMPLAMNFLYEQHHYKSQRQATDAALRDIFDKLRASFEKLLAENHLQLDAAEKQFILEELHTMNIKIGNIPTQLSQAFVEQYYANININATDFYANHLQLLKHITRRQQVKLSNHHTTAEEAFYEHDPATASSSSPVKLFENAVLVPYGYLQLPFFQHDLHALFQYSLFGFILAHEIIHAYDLFHIVYDQHGNYNEMGAVVAQHFWQHIECFLLHPSDSLSENIADVAGLRLAYQTYFDDALNNLPKGDFALPDTNYTSQQLFFINSVQFLCANMAKISTLDVKALNLEHDMHDVRVRQNWANFEQFAAAFQCKPATSMHPTQHCRLW